jgi:hypothetical protein
MITILEALRLQLPSSDEKCPDASSRTVSHDAGGEELHLFEIGLRGKHAGKLQLSATSDGDSETFESRTPLGSRFG